MFSKINGSTKSFWKIVMEGSFKYWQGWQTPRGSLRTSTHPCRRSHTCKDSTHLMQPQNYSGVSAESMISNCEPKEMPRKATRIATKSRPALSHCRHWQPLANPNCFSYFLSSLFYLNIVFSSCSTAVIHVIDFLLWVNIFLLFCFGLHYNRLSHAKMASTIAIALIAGVAYWIYSNFSCLFKNIAAAKRSGLPYVIVR